MRDEGKSIISLVHIMLQVKVTFSLKFCKLGCFSIEQWGALLRVTALSFGG